MKFKILELKMFQGKNIHKKKDISRNTGATEKAS